MAGVKGKSGGKRPGAGRKPKTLPTATSKPVKDKAPQQDEPAPEPDEPEADVMPVTDDPMVFLTALMNCSAASANLRKEAAKALLPFVHAKKGEGGKKEQRQSAAEKVVSGRFAPSEPPKLAAVGGKKV